VPTNLNEFCPASADGFKTYYQVEMGEIKWCTIRKHAFLVYIASGKHACTILVLGLFKLPRSFQWLLFLEILDGVEFWAKFHKLIVPNITRY
jgi:hypothetical protein